MINDASQLVLNNDYFVEFTFGLKHITMTFSRISAVTQKAEFETIVEGSGQVHLIPKYMSSPNTLVFEKGIFINGDDESCLKTGRYISNGMIKVMKNNQKVRTYTFFDGVVTQCEIGEFDALSSKVLIQKFTVSYTDLQVTFKKD